ncbi:MAG: NAD(P)-dependent oxidoreductase [Lachnospiraceae bacterium]|nr:NAD(P)-dependent oxidoreductase [Lachnospiraceae bacterium]
MDRTIGFIGLGVMGKPMAMNLLKSGAALMVYSPSGASYPAFEKAGAETAKQIRELAGRDLIFLCLPNSAVVEEVLCGEDGLIRQMHEGQAVVDLSTITYASTVQIAKALEEQKIDFLDAPVSGMEKRAIDGTLTIMCGGREETFRRVRPYLDCMGTKVLYMGDHGSGQLTKLVNQLLYDINAAALAEILPLSVKMGLDSQKIGEVINSGTGRSYASEFFIPRDLERRFDEGYSLENAYKDLVSAAELGVREGIPLPVLAAATATYQTAMLRGFGKENKGAMIKVFEELLGVEFRKKET